MATGPEWQFQKHLLEFVRKKPRFEGFFARRVGSAIVVTLESTGDERRIELARFRYAFLVLRENPDANVSQIAEDASAPNASFVLAITRAALATFSPAP